MFHSATLKWLINEVNLIDPKYPAKNDYIELKQTKDRGNEMPSRGYKVVGFSCKSNSGTIDTVATLWNFRMNKHGFFTIGGNSLRVNVGYVRTYAFDRSHCVSIE